MFPQKLNIRQYGEETGKAGGIDTDLLRAEERNRESRVCHVTRYGRNLLGQVETITDALGQTERYTYDAKGQLIEKLDKEGYLTKYGYTAQGDVSRIAYADGREVKLSYNPLRQLEEMEDWLGVTRIENNAAGRALRVQYPDGKEVSYTYGKSGERTGITYPDGKRAEYLYDGELRLSGLRDGNGTITYGYDEKGRLARKSFPNGMETTYAYNGAGLLSELLHRDKEGVLDRYCYRYDLTGNKTVIEKQRRGLPEESGLYAYGYDALGRLNSVAKDGQSLRTYEYDAFGNRSLLREGSQETSYVYNALNQLVSRADAWQEETYTYDKRGNLSLITADGALKNRYTYGAINRLEQAVNGNGEAASYTYNGLGHRVEKITGPEAKIRYTIDLTKSYHNLLQKEEGGDVQTYLWDGNIAGIAGDNGRSGRYYLKDELGSPIRLTNESGELTETYGYDEFGQDLYGNQGVIQPFGYTGYQADRTAGTYYAQAREYRAELGRFAAADTIKGRIDIPLSLNSYFYCFNAPINYIDKDGLWPEIPNWGKILIGIGAIAVGVAVTVASGGAALPAVMAGLKVAATAGAVSAATSAGITATKSIISGEDDIKTGFQKTVQAAEDGFSSGFMWGGIMFGASASYAFFKSSSFGLHIGKTMKPQYGRLSLGYGDAEKHTQTLFSIQNMMGKSRFRLDVDLNNYLHIHYGMTNSALKIHRTGIVESIVGFVTGVNSVNDETESCEND